MKHIRQSSQKHAPGSLDVTEDMPFFTPATNQRAVLGFPKGDSFEKLVPIYRRPYPGNLKEDLPEPPGVCSPGKPAAPGQALPLYMDQASLHYDTRPEMPEHSHYVGIAIHGKAVWVQSSLLQTFKEFGKLRVRILWNTVLTGYKHMGTGIHQGNKATRAAQESAIKNEMLTSAQPKHWRRCRLFQLAAYHFVKLSRTIFTLAHQLSYRVTLDNPQSE